MLKNYFKIAWRAFVKDRTYAMINLFGLAIALACVLMIGAYVRYELSFDKSYSNSDRIYRVVVEEKKDSLDKKSFMMPNALAYTLKSEFPEIEAVTKIDKYSIDVVADNKKVNIETILVDSSFFHLFNLPFINGNGSSSLSTNRNIVLTESTITISLLGLFSMVALISRQRTKEIGIRKVLGASVIEIISLLSGSFIKLILIAFVIATPLAWLAMNKWLQDYQYRTEINWWIFLIAGVGSLLIALTVIAAQAIRSAVANPGEALRTE